MSYLMLTLSNFEDMARKKKDDQLTVVLEK